MKKFVDSAIGRFRLVAFLEGVSFIILVFIGMPLKYSLENPAVVKSFGPVHGALFLLFIFMAFRLSFEEDWSFKKTTWKVMLASLIPFGTFVLDAKILAKMQEGTYREI